MRSLRSRRVASAYRYRWLNYRNAGASGGLRDANQRRAQIPLHINRQRFDRRNVEHAATLVLRRLRLEE